LAVPFWSISGASTAIPSIMPDNGAKGVNRF